MGEQPPRVRFEMCWPFQISANAILYILLNGSTNLVKKAIRMTNSILLSPGII